MTCQNRRDTILLSSLCSAFCMPFADKVAVLLVMQLHATQQHFLEPHCD